LTVVLTVVRSSFSLFGDTPHSYNPATWIRFRFRYQTRIDPIAWSSPDLRHCVFNGL